MPNRVSYPTEGQAAAMPRRAKGTRPPSQDRTPAEARRTGCCFKPRGVKDFRVSSSPRCFVVWREKIRLYTFGLTRCVVSLATCRHSSTGVRFRYNAHPFLNTEFKRSALAQLAGRFSFKSWANGDMLVPEDALPYLAVQGVSFTVEGPATYEQHGSAFRGTAPAAV